MIIEELVEKAENFNLKEIRKYNQDMEVLNAISSNAALKLAKKYNADKNIVRIAVAMMDSKLPEAAHLGVGKEHIKMSAEAAKELLKDADCLDEKQKENIIKCVE